ncbi:MAG TPA: HAMP domain-containing sensor histidine kinase [Candidatus Dormibacteraeota bacterium]|nr:HAMP domain-containing sensor histidine kinase [Candidatus Dormibacteraeota bacterium]
MSFRTRLSALVAAAVAVSVVAASVALYFLVRGQMLGEVDAALRDRVTSVKTFVVNCPAGTSCATALQKVPGDTSCQLGIAQTVPTAQPTPSPQSSGSICGISPADAANFRAIPPPALGGAGGFTQFVTAQGVVILAPGERVSLPVTEADRAAAAGAPNILFEDATINGTPVRIATAAVGPGQALQVARPLDEVDAVLSRLRWILVGVCIIGVALAAFLGRLVARTTLRPVDRLIGTTEYVAGTQDLRQRITEPGDGELGRLAHSFNRMLEALDESQATQRQLVADASHELRTPLSSLRTNIEVLARAPGLDPQERDRLLGDVQGQLERLSRLVADLIDLARGDAPSSIVHVDVQLDELVAGAVDVARAQFPDVHFAVDAQASVVEGDPGRLERAVANLLDNAAKWSPAGGEIAVGVQGAEVTVRDHGPGVATDHVSHIFDRFWRAPEARQKPGSGLGLSIVRQVARSHGGDVSVESAAGGGALFRLRLRTTS